MAQQFLKAPNVVSEARRHPGRPVLPAAVTLIDFDPQRFDMARKVVHHILPDTGGCEHLHLLGKAETQVSAGYFIINCLAGDYQYSHTSIDRLWAIRQ